MKRNDVPPSARLNPSGWAVLASCCLALSGGLLLLGTSGCGALPGFDAALNGRIGTWNEHLVTRGILVPEQETKVSAQVLTQVKFLVEDGRRVEKGDVVCELVMTRTEENLRRRRDAFDTAEINMKKQREMAVFNKRLIALKLAQTKNDLARRGEERDQARDFRDWDRITEEEENQKVQVLEGRADILIAQCPL